MYVVNEGRVEGARLTISLCSFLNAYKSPLLGSRNASPNR